MGHKVNPVGLRLNLTKKWTSRWIASKKNFASQLAQDEKIRNFLKKKFRDAAISNIAIFRSNKLVEVSIYTAKPGIVIGRSGSGMNEIKDLIKKEYVNLVKPEDQPRIKIHVEEVRNIENSAKLVAENVAFQIEKRMPPKRVMRQALNKLKEKGIEGAKIRVSGRIGGADIARSEVLAYGSLPLHTFKKNIDFSALPALTTYGTIGVKVWLNLGNFDFDQVEELEEREQEKRKER